MIVILVFKITRSPNFGAKQGTHVLEYGILPNTHAGANTKNPDGRMYSGLNISKSERCQVALGIPELAVSFSLKANQAFMCTQLTEIKWLLVILDL